MEKQGLETFYWKNRTSVRNRVKWAESEEKTSNEKIRHLRNLLSDASINTAKCDVCKWATKRENFEQVQCIVCRKEREVCSTRCREKINLETLEGYCCLKCLSHESLKRKSDLLDSELYELKKQKKLKTDPSLENVVILPFRSDEAIIASGLIGVSYSLRKEEENEDNQYFVCDICDITLPLTSYIGNCLKCEKKLGSCCNYDDQWPYGSVDSLSSQRFLCPFCVEEESFSISSSLSDSDDYDEHSL